MWLFMNDSFLSVVADTKHPNNLLVRARMHGDIEAVVPNAKVTIDMTCDYPCRASINRHIFAIRMSERIADIEYDSFKDTCADPHRHNAYMSVWSVMINEFQKVCSKYKWPVKEVK